MDGFSSANQLLHSLIDSLRDPAVGGIGQYLLALVFTISGVVKLRSPQQAADAIQHFGFGRRPHTYLGLLLGLVEVIVAVMLASSMWLALWIAALLLWLFTVLVGRSLLTGQLFACFCFGSSDAAMSWLTLTRTASLAALASLLVFESEPGSGMFALGDRLAQAVTATALLALFMLLARTFRLLQLSRTALHALENPPT